MPDGIGQIPRYVGGVRTLLNQFCEEFGNCVEPLFPSLQTTSRALQAADQENPARTVLPQLRELTDQLHTLSDKVSEQRAFVLLFGPLKSGKSTLMNALSAEYVSEVTALPAYPCLVNVSHAADRELVLTRYDGSSERMQDLQSMRHELQRAHGELADRIRQVESAGEVFDPVVHSPRAVRRVEVKLPAVELERSGTVLVDTPGLYTRMKFGYDRLTRDFRDTAACAIFVVRTDNLFLEQVFDEFNELLELFSRIFLVVNLDTTKQDLQPDGSLAPSLEHEDPLRILDAFEQLAMSAPLKAALDDGRLKIYPVDLLRAASERLRDGVEAGGSDFRQFRTDLTDYLNSSDYLAAFLRDSLRRATSLTGDLAGICDAEPVRELAGLAADLERDQAVAQQKLETLKRLEGFSWEEAYRPLREQLAADLAETAAVVREKTSRALVGALESWYRTDSSLKDLGDQELAPLLGSCQNELALAIHQTLNQQLSAGAGGPKVPSGVRVSLTAAGLSLDRIGREAFDGLDPYAGIEPAALPLQSTAIPVKKGFWDWILFRSQATVAKRLFGPPENPKNRVAKAAKTRKLGPPARQMLAKAVADFFESFYPRSSERLLDRVFRDYTQPSIQTLQTGLIELERSCRDRLVTAERRLAEISRVRLALGDLDQGLGEIRRRLGEMSQLYASLPLAEGEIQGILPVGTGSEPVEALALEEEAPAPEADSVTGV
ncbi:MAG: GTPase domain-containing protein [Planctomycetes bacterium]|nr:GTPase domain-containing protein [Planctomycetota bacterium]